MNSIKCAIAFLVMFSVNCFASVPPKQDNWLLVVNPTLTTLPAKTGPEIKVMDYIITSLTDDILVMEVITDNKKCIGFMGLPGRPSLMNEGYAIVYRVPVIQAGIDCTPKNMIILTNKGDQTFSFN